MSIEELKRKENEQVVASFLQLLADKKMDEWGELWAKKAVQDMPFSPSGFPKRVEGREALIKHYSGLPETYGSMAFPELTFRPMLDPDWVLAEYRGELEVIATGNSYNNYYCGLFHLQKGRILLFREYYNPNALTRAFGGIEELTKSFSLKENS